MHDRLNELNITSFLPVRKALRVRRDRKKYVDEPLFPSYVFIYLKDMQCYYGGINSEGALYYVRTGQQITRVQESVINNIKLVTDQSNDLEVSEERFQPGRKLVISQGVLAGLSCELVEIDNHQKLLVRVDLLRRHLLLSLPSESLIAM